MSVTRNQAERIASVLSEGLPYIQKFSGKIIVIKYGGAAMSKKELKNGFAKDIALMKLVGMKPIIIHGGGPQISKELKREGISSIFISGNRVTSAKSMKIIKRVLANKVNKEIVSLIEKNGAKAFSLTHKNSRVIKASRIDNEVNPKLGLVGRVSLIKKNPIKKLLAKNIVPVISPIGFDNKENFLNINADLVAAKVAECFKAEKLILLTDVKGIEGIDRSLLTRITPKKAKSILLGGIVRKGMKPKLLASLEAISKGVKSSHIIDGRLPHAVLLEVLTKEGVGTLITSK
ncbi:uncharacterized protein METZ01_LOCUS139491 [marine metagenome]|uniref:acetylglutamate kinase n=1 Tax=marine metagenome TaxID=408172 RepID=A0A381ZCZ1_9ZZZZ